MRIMTILGTRPEIIRLSRIIPKLDQFASRHILVHTGQNKHHLLSDVFFTQLGLRQPNYTVQLDAFSFAQQISQIFAQVEGFILKEKPEKILLLGDTNSALCAILGERLQIPVYHMEAGNRCFDPLVPEEINRKAIDAVSSYNLPYTEIARDNLLREGIPKHKVWVTGNPIYEVLQYYRKQIEQSDILEKLALEKGNYIVLTAHRSENVDSRERLQNIFAGLTSIADELQIPIICSVHPRTQQRLNTFGVQISNPLVRLSEPFGFFDFVKLQSLARCVITDSGTVQEESCILGIPSVTIRNSTERPETIMCGSNVLSGLEPERILQCVKLMIETKYKWERPKEYLDQHVSNKVVSMVLGGLHYV